MTLPEAIIELRKALCDSQQGLAERLSISSACISKWERQLTEPRYTNRVRLSALARTVDRADLETVFTPGGLSVEEAREIDDARQLTEYIRKLEEFFQNIQQELARVCLDDRLTDDDRRTSIEAAWRLARRGEEFARVISKRADFSLDPEPSAKATPIVSPPKTPAEA